MDNFKKGDQVRQIGKSKVMTVVGPAALGMVSTRPGHVSTLQGRIICTWSNVKGQQIQKSFAEAKLEQSN